MSTIIELAINNYKGIKAQTFKFKPDQRLICLIGRGDSCKTTVLEAISNVLSPNWNLNFYDTDFFDCNSRNTIHIEASLIDFPEKFQSEEKYGLYLRNYNPQTQIISDEFTEETSENIPCITIRLKVDESLEPTWTIINSRREDGTSINSTDRAKLNCYMISDYVDRHFSWNKGNPLYSLLRASSSSQELENTNMIMKQLREAKEKIDEIQFESLENTTLIIKQQAYELGLGIDGLNTTLDFKELSIKDGKISLHENKIPYRQKGKGSRRLASIAIQSALVQHGGIMLIDEIEQGLEPDRIKEAVRTLSNYDNGQIFLTTHSRDAITELGASPLVLMINDDQGLQHKRLNNMQNEELTKAVRACPEAFFAKKVIVCEGATEVGICRALNTWRKNNHKASMSTKDCSYIDGHGDTFVSRVDEIHNTQIIKVCIFCDSDKSDIQRAKREWNSSGIKYFDCEDTFDIEKQLFHDLPWNVIKEIIQYIIENKYKNISNLENQIRSMGITIQTDWLNLDSAELRRCFTILSTKDKQKWFKKVHHGENIGNIILNHIKEIDQDKRIKKILMDLSEWIDSE